MMNESWEVCRDERCEEEGLHAPHEVESRRRPYHERRLPWGIRQRALDDSIIDVVPAYEVQTFRGIHRAVEDTYGSVNPRTLHRRIARLIDFGQIVRLEIPAEAICAYVRPSSPFAGAPVEEWREQAITACYEHGA